MESILKLCLCTEKGANDTFVLFGMNIFFYLEDIQNWPLSYLGSKSTYSLLAALFFNSFTSQQNELRDNLLSKLYLSKISTSIIWKSHLLTWKLDLQ